MNTRMERTDGVETYNMSHSIYDGDEPYEAYHLGIRSQVEGDSWVVSYTRTNGAEWRRLSAADDGDGEGARVPVSEVRGMVRHWKKLVGADDAFPVPDAEKWSL